MRAIPSALLSLVLGFVLVQNAKAFGACDIGNPILPCHINGTVYDTFAGNYSAERAFYKANSYQADTSEGFLSLGLKDGLPHNHGWIYIVGYYGDTIWISPPPYNAEFKIFGGFNGAGVEQANHFEWIGAGSPTPTPLWFYPVVPYDPGSYKGRFFFYDQNHLGEDEALPEGTPIQAIGTGKVVWYKKASGYGELVAVVEHDLGEIYTFTNAYGEEVRTKKILSIYGHIRKCDNRDAPTVCTNITVGDLVDFNTVIGYINDDAHNGDGKEHLHLGIRLSSAAVARQRDPAAWFRGYEGDTTFGTDFTAASTAIQILRGE